MEVNAVNYVVYIYFIDLFAEKGLKQAERITDALYKGSVDALGELNYEEVTQTFAGAKVVDLLAEPGMSMLQLAMKAKCFNNESKQNYSQIHKHLCNIYI